MISVLFFNTIAVFFAWLESSGRYKHGLKLSLFTVFLFLALRYDYGNDYMGYLNFFLNQSASKFANVYNYAFEPGWDFLNLLFKPFGFFAMQAMLAVATCIVLYRFIKIYCPIKYYWFAVFYYVFQPFQMLVLSSAMRQAVAGLLFILAIDFILKKKVIRYLIIIFIATLFHKTAFFLFPLILLGFMKQRWSNIQTLLIILVFFFIILMPDILYNEITSLLTGDFSKYEVYTSSTVSLRLGIGWLLMIIINLFIILNARFAKTISEILLFKIAILSFIVYQLIFVVPLVTRLTFYLNPVLMVVFPFVFLKIKSKGTKLSYMFLVVIFIISQFYLFFLPTNWGEHFGVYKTIFSAPSFY